MSKKNFVVKNYQAILIILYGFGSIICLFASVVLFIKLFTESYDVNFDFKLSFSPLLLIFFIFNLVKIIKQNNKTKDPPPKTR